MMSSQPKDDRDPNYVPLGAGTIVFALGMLAGVAVALWATVLARVLM